MCCFGKKNLQIQGYIILGALIAAAAICIILVGIQFQNTNASWSGKGWGALGAVQLASIIYVFIIAAVGYFAFIFANLILLIIFVILLGVSALFTLAIAIFALVSGSIGFWNESVGCSTKYQGILDAWESIDTYLVQVDSALCSTDCPCYFNTTTSLRFLTNTTSAPYYNFWYKSPVATAASKYQDCTYLTQNNTYLKYVNTNAYSNYTLDSQLFAQYYYNIENKFNCTGFCETTYFNDRSGTNMKMSKYLFTDIGRGVPDHIGCLQPILNWLPAVMKAFGAIALAVVAIEGYLVYLAIALMVKREEGEEPKEQHIEITNRNAETEKKHDAGKDEKNHGSSNQVGFSVAVGAEVNAGPSQQ